MTLKSRKRYEADLARSRPERMRWWCEARYGMFVHWGLYCLIGRNEWVQAIECIPKREYETLADRFSPKPGAARAWARLARDAGMKYMVMTTKHHEGFCLWDTAQTTYNSVQRACGRDLVAEYVDACREFGLRIGFYYSLMDWHHPDGARCAHDPAARRRFLDFTRGCVRELVTTLNKDESSEPAILGELRRDTRADTPGRAIQQVALERAAAQIIIVTANSRGCTMKRCEVGLHWTRDDLWHRRKRVVYTGDARAVALAFLKKKKPKGHGGITAIAPVGPRTCITDRQCRFKEKCVAGHCKKTASVTRKWWFWTIIGAVVVGTTVAIAVPLSSPDNPVIEVK